MTECNPRTPKSWESWWCSVSGVGLRPGRSGFKSLLSHEDFWVSLVQSLPASPPSGSCCDDKRKELCTPTLSSLEEGLYKKVRNKKFFKLPFLLHPNHDKTLAFWRSLKCGRPEDFIKKASVSSGFCLVELKHNLNPSGMKVSHWKVTRSKLGC